MAAIWFRKLSLLAAILALCVVVLGAYVRLSDAGLGCPDWPGCYGSLTVPQSEEAIQHAQIAYPDKVIEKHKAWKEMLHRYLAGTLGLVIFSLFVLGWKSRRIIRVSPWLSTALLLLVMLQAMLGMWTVTLLLKPVVVSAHLIGGMSTLALLVWIAHRHYGVATQRFLPSALSRAFVRIALLVLFAQIFLGGWTSSNYAGLACTDFPTCHGALVPELDFKNAFHWVRALGEGANGEPLSLTAIVTVQWIHRIGALTVLLYLGFLGWFLLKQKPLRMLAMMMLVLLIAQISIGIANLILHLPLVLAVAHNLGAALLLIIIVVLNSRITELPK